MADQHMMEVPYKSFPSDKTSAHAYPPPTSAPYPPAQNTLGAGVYPPLPAGTVVTDYPAPGPICAAGVIYVPPTSVGSAPIGVLPSYTYTTESPPQQPSSNTVVVNQQPQVTKVVDSQSGGAPESFSILSYLMCFACFCFGNWLTFICIIPAMIFSDLSEKRASAGDYIGARTMGCAALICNIAAIVFYVIAVVIVIIAAVVVQKK